MTSACETTWSLSSFASWIKRLDSAKAEREYSHASETLDDTRTPDGALPEPSVRELEDPTPIEVAGTMIRDAAKEVMELALFSITLSLSRLCFETFQNPLGGFEVELCYSFKCFLPVLFNDLSPRVNNSLAGTRRKLDTDIL